MFDQTKWFLIDREMQLTKWWLDYDWYQFTYHSQNLNTEELKNFKISSNNY